MRHDALTILHLDEDIVGRMTVQRSPEPLLVKMMTDEPNASSKNEQAVERADLDVLVRLLGRERTAVTEQVHEADRNATVDVEDELQDTSVVGRELTGE